MRLQAAPGLKLIETLGWDGVALVRLPAHLARIEAAAVQLGWVCRSADLRDALIAAAQTGPARLRLTLDATGNHEVEIAPMPPGMPLWRLALASGRLFSADPWLTIKSSHRPAYDAARAALPDGVDEVIFLNQRDEVCDGSITTVFFDRGDGLRTPPQTCGLLPGVLRAAMLADGQCREEVLLARDLAHVRLWVGNSLRGLEQATWLG